MTWFHDNKARVVVLSFGPLMGVRAAFYYGGLYHMSLTLTDSQSDVVVAAGADVKGRPAPIFTPVWTISDPTIASITPSTDGMSCTVVGLKPGTVTLTFTAEPSQGATTPLTASLPITIEASPAVSVTLTPGTPVNQ